MDRGISRHSFRGAIIGDIKATLQRINQSTLDSGTFAAYTRIAFWFEMWFPTEGFTRNKTYKGFNIEVILNLLDAEITVSTTCLLCLPSNSKEWLLMEAQVSAMDKFRSVLLQMFVVSKFSMSKVHYLLSYVP
jgi:hypothetical protein